MNTVIDGCTLIMNEAIKFEMHVSF